MTLAPWRSHLSGALHRNRSLAYARYFQLATLRLDGTPANRTVVFRGFHDGEGDRLQIVTDDRSAKIEQIERDDRAEACWYFPKSRDQFRLRGRLTLVRPHCDDEELQRSRHHVWHNLSDNARSGFAWAHPGGDRAPDDAFDVAPPDPNQPLDSFTLMLLEPVTVDVLKLRGEPQNRYIYERDAAGQWTEREVNP